MGFVLSEKTTIGVCIFSNDTKTTLHSSIYYSFQNVSCSLLNLAFPFLYCSYTKVRNVRSSQIKIEKMIVLKTVAYTVLPRNKVHAVYRKVRVPYAVMYLMPWYTFTNPFCGAQPSQNCKNGPKKATKPKKEHFL